MDLRRMTAADLGPVAALTAQLGYEVPADVLREVFGRIEALREHQALVAVEDGRIVGWVHVFGTLVLFDEPFAEIGAIVVDEGRQRSRVGTALLRAAEEWARAAGYADLRVRSRLSRHGAHRFYVRLGYEKEKAQYTFVRRL